MVYSLFTYFGAGCEHKFVGLVPWYHYLKRAAYPDCSIQGFNILPHGQGVNSVPSSIPLVLLAVVQDLITIAGLVAVVFVVMGAIGYVTSQGNPDEAAKARGTIINALIGLVIAIVAVSFVAFIGNKLS